MKRSTGLPTLVIMCAPCQAAGKRRKLAEFDLGWDGPSQTHHTLGQWNDDDTKVHLRCEYGHDPQVSRQWILETLGSLDGKATIYL